VGSSGTILSATITVPTTTSLTSAPNPSLSGQLARFSAHVTSTGGTPTGSVTFKEGSTALGTVALASGTAVFSTSTLALGTHAITAVYLGGGGFLASTSNMVSQVVNLAPIVVHGLRITATRGTAFTSKVVGSFSDVKPGMTLGNYLATIDWGDGTFSAGSIIGASGSFSIIGSHTYSTANAASVYSINVTIGVNDGRAAYLASLAQVS
jgi:hypothetical protein